jgi:RimJ/RimL family protein N-acetyltransferase
MTPELETARLLLRPLALSDAEQAQLLFPQWEIVRYLNSRVPWPYPPDGALTFYREVALPAVERGEAWHWTLRLKSNPGQMIGNISLMRGGLETEIWEITAEEWQARRETSAPSA